MAQVWRNGETPESSGLKGDKLVGKYYVAFDKAYKEEVRGLVHEGVPERRGRSLCPPPHGGARHVAPCGNVATKKPSRLWKTMNSWVYAGFETTYATMGVEFDKLYYESDTYLTGKERVLEGLGDGRLRKNGRRSSLDRPHRRRSGSKSSCCARTAPLCT